jgi:hypothetical protein
MPALNVLSSSVDFLSISIRHLSLSLRELKMVQTAMSLDFLWPLDEKDHSLPSNTSLHWPNLEFLTLQQFQPWLPSGKNFRCMGTVYAISQLHLNSLMF